MARASDSAHLKELLSKKSGSIDAQIVFVDIVDYSKRKSTTQRQIVEQLQIDILNSIKIIAASNLDFVQKNNINLSTDTIILPTGDGAALIFSFGGIQSAGIDFARDIIRQTSQMSSNDKCDKYEANGWCNCHKHYKLRIGINEGKLILFEDLNGNVNASGTSINDAARVMGRADGQQILMSENAYNNLIDMTEDVSLEEKFSSIGTLTVKHGKEIKVHQYIGSGQEPFINKELPFAIAVDAQMKANMSMMGMPDNMSKQIDKQSMLKFAKAMGEAIQGLEGFVNFPKMINGQPEEKS